ncbi:MAG: hypothetical protein NTU44_17845 [Bacteroidetes bacterium]|nr:hypothetical protein [Bacteroidota bacterium]
MKRTYTPKTNLRQATGVKTKAPVPETKPVDLAKSNRNQLFFLLFFSVLIYANTLWPTFRYALDDALMITDNSYTKKGISGLKDIMTHDAFTGFFGVQKKLVAGGRYRPLSQVMFALEYQFFGLSPFIGHLMNILLYACCIWILFLILKKLLIKLHHAQWYRSLPFIATLLFICHPLHTEVVANIKGRDEILSLLGSLLTLHLAILYIEKRKIIHLLLMMPVFFLALLAKENAITFLGVIILVFYFFKKVNLKDYLVVFAPLLAATAGYLVLRNNALGYLVSPVKIVEILNDPYVNSSLAEKLATNTLTWGIYLKLLLFPHPLTHDYYPWQISLTNWGNPLVLLTFAFYLGLLVVAIKGLKKKTILSFSILFFFITFSISSNLVFNIGTFMNERFMFIPLLGFTLALAYFITQKLPSWFSGGAKPGSLIPTLLIVLCLAYSVKTFSRNFTWQDDFTLFTTDVKTSVNSAKCNVSAGGMYLVKAEKSKSDAEKTDLLNKAEANLRKAIEIYSGNSSAWVLLGNVYLERKDYTNASDFYINCLKIFSTQTEATQKLKLVAVTAGDDGNYELGIKDIKFLISCQPHILDNYIQLADMYSKTNRAEPAMAMLDSIIVKNPEFPDAYSKKGEIFGRVYQDIDKALELLSKAYKMDAKNTSTLENLGICYGIKRDFKQSLDFFNKALAISPESPRLLSNMASSYNMMGDKAKAEEYMKRSAEAKAKEK